jgi:type I restriction enzyme S subunit
MKKSHFGVKSGGEIMSKAQKDYLPWKECKLGDVCFFQRGHDLPKTDMLLGNIPVAGSNGIIGYHSITTTKGPGVTIGRSGNIGTPKFYQTDFWAHNTVLYVKDFKGNDEKFVYYFLHIFDFTGFNAGSAVPTLNRNHIHEIPILLPPLPEQQAIAGVLSSLDDKIDLLHRQNKTLEAMAETLFRQWFVEEADEEWEEKPLSYIANFLNGLACQKFPPQNEIEKLPVLKIRELNNGITEASDWATSNVNQEYIVDLGDIIFAWSASLMVKIWDGEKCVLNQHLFKVTSEKYPKWFYLYWTKHHLDEFIAISKSHATTMGHIKRKDLDNAMVLLPSNKELNQMTKIMEPIVEKKIKNYQQLSILKKFHDILLPKLMNGEVRISSQMELT